MIIVRILIWLVVLLIITSWGLFMAWLIHDVHDLIADPTSDQRDESA